jgi:toxin CcdB
MAKFDVHRLKADGSYVLDCQADLLRSLNTRLVVPLILVEEAPTAGARLNPIFTIEGRHHAMVTQYAGSMPVADLGEVVTTLSEHDLTVGNALDMLISGF